MNNRHVLLLSLLSLGACSSSVEGGGSGGSGGSDGSSSSSSSSGGLNVQCVGDPIEFPTFDKTCSAPADCVTALHQINCCGTLNAIGINATEKAAFDAAETTCRSQYPGCGCAQFPTMTEDGKMSMDDAQIQVDCMNGKCSTFLP